VVFSNQWRPNAAMPDRRKAPASHGPQRSVFT
jgi:hypothetical protein